MSILSQRTYMGLLEKESKLEIVQTVHVQQMQAAIGQEGNQISAYVSTQSQGIYMSTMYLCH